MRRILVDERQRELKAHGTPQFPLEVSYDNLRDFWDTQIRCHWHDELEISLVLQGTARYVLGKGTYLLSAGQGILINARVPHTVTPTLGTDVRLLAVILHPSLVAGPPGEQIDSDFMTPFLRARSLAAVPLDPETQSFFLKIGEVASERAFAWELRCKELLCGAFYQIFTQYQQELSGSRAATEADLQRLDRLLELLHSRYDQPLDLQSLAAEVGLARESCCRFFKRMTGQTFSQYLETYRVWQGARLLRETDCGIMEAALQVGFTNAGRFSAAFSKRMGCTPSRFFRSQPVPHFTHSEATEKA